MATTGKFEIITDALGALRSDEMALIVSEDVYQVKTAEIIGSSGRAFKRLELDFPKVVGLQTFDVMKLPLALFSFLSAEYLMRYRPVSGSLDAWLTADSSAVNGKFHMEMKRQSDGDTAGPEDLVVDGVFSLKN
ncbi:hypothetical protein [Pseudomonas lini]